MGTSPNSRDIFRNYINTFIYVRETSKYRLRAELLNERINWSISVTVLLFTTGTISLLFANIHSWFSHLVFKLRLPCTMYKVPLRMVLSYISSEGILLFLNKDVNSFEFKRFKHSSTFIIHEVSNNNSLAIEIINT